MKATTLTQHLKLAIAAKRPAFVWGDPGIGKSQIVAALAKDLEYQLLDWRLALKDSVDLVGIPHVAPHPEDKKNATFWNPPAELPRSGKWIIFMDELPQAALQVQNAATSLILDRRLGSYVLPDDVVIIAAGNLDTNRAGTTRMPTHVANRFLHFTLQVHTQDWLDWALNAGIDARIIAFIKYRPEFLQMFDPMSKEKAFASPRSWEFVSQMIKEAEKAKLSWGAEEQLELVAGIVGQKAAVEFVGFLRIMDKLVSIDSIMLNPDKAKLPDDAAVTYALTYALADRSDRKNFAAVTTYVQRLKQEWQFLFFREIDRRKPDLKKSKEFIKFSAANADFI